MAGRRPLTASRSARPANWLSGESLPRSNIVRVTHQTNNPIRQRSIPPSLNESRIHLPVSRSQRETSTHRNPFSAGNRATSPFQQRTASFGRSGSQQQNNSGDAPATSSGVSALNNPFSFPGVSSSSPLSQVRQSSGGERTVISIGPASTSFDRPN